MLLMQEPKLLLLDEPVAGMSDEETERTAELFLALAGAHSLVVVEHDMAFIEKIARKVTVLHEGAVIAEGPMAAGAGRPARDRGVSRQMTALAVTQLNQFYGGSHILRDLSFDVPCGQGDCAARRNGVGKTTLLRTLMGVIPAKTGAIKFGEHDLTAAKAVRARARGNRLRAAGGREIFPAADGRGESAHGTRDASLWALRYPSRCVRDVPGAEADDAARGGDLSGRPAAAAGRSAVRSPAGAEAPDPRRTSGRHSTILSSRTSSARSATLAETGEMAIPARRAVLRFRALTREPVTS
jgi:ABC-type branched-subunit amino acid transport system ATPase component